MRLLGCLLACSKRTAIYSGAGLSTASGVRQVFLAEFPLNHFMTLSEQKKHTTSWAKTLSSIPTRRPWENANELKVLKRKPKSPESEYFDFMIIGFWIFLISWMTLEGFGKKTEAEPSLAHYGLSALVHVEILILIWNSVTNFHVLFSYYVIQIWGPI